jgi:hypothetical protein
MKVELKIPHLLHYDKGNFIETKYPVEDTSLSRDFQSVSSLQPSEMNLNCILVYKRKEKKKTDLRKLIIDVIYHWMNTASCLHSLLK